VPLLKARVKARVKVEVRVKGLIDKLTTMTL